MNQVVSASARSSTLDKDLTKAVEELLKTTDPSNSYEDIPNISRQVIRAHILESPSKQSSSSIKDNDSQSSTESINMTVETNRPRESFDSNTAGEFA